MNYQDYIKYDPEKKQYTDSYGYVIDGISSLSLPSEQRAQQPVRINKAIFVDADAGQHPRIAVDSTNSAFTHLLLESNGSAGSVKTNNSLVVGSANANQLTLGTTTSATTITPSGTDNVIDVVINPKGGDGCLKVGSNFAKHIAILANNAAKLTTFYSGSTSADLTIESKGASGKIIFTNNNTSYTQYEKLELQQTNGSSTFTATTTQVGAYPNADINFVPRGLGIVKCNSWTYDAISSTGSPQALSAGVNTKVTINDVIYNDFPAGFMTTTADTFQNTSGRAITLMVSACIRENPESLVSGRNLSFFITRSNNSTYLYGQALLNSTTDTTNPTGARALNTTAIIQLANNESFSVWAYSNTGVTIGGTNTWNLSIITFRLMP